MQRWLWEALLTNSALDFLFTGGVWKTTEMPLGLALSFCRTKIIFPSVSYCSSCDGDDRAVISEINGAEKGCFSPAVSCSSLFLFSSSESLLLLHRGV